jgi:transcription termination factor Rho
MHLRELQARTAAELLTLAESLSVDNASALRRQDLTFAILKKHSEQDAVITADGVIDVLPDGFGFLRSQVSNYLPASDDIYVTNHHIRSFHLRTGDVIEGVIIPPKEGEKYFTLSKIAKINQEDPSASRRRISFENLTPLFPSRKLNLEPLDNMGKTKDLTLRMIDLIAPIGFGQRALVVAPPRTGKTVLLQTLIRAVMHHHPEAHLIVLLIDERPEEVTDMIRTVKNGEVISSTFDEPAVRHIQVTEIVLEKAKRLVEAKKDVIIFLDSITRLARAYNTVVPSSGKVLTGGVDSNALQKPKRVFGAARNVEEGGS